MTDTGATRVRAAIDAARRERLGALVGYLPLGFPELETSVAAAIALAENGCDIIELGVPYTDPVMDGPVIQEATGKALRQGFRFHQVFPAVKEIFLRTGVPVLLMSYWNPVRSYGVKAFARELATAGGAGMITPDLTPENAGEWIDAARTHDLASVFLAAPTSTEERLKNIVAQSRGFVYAVSTMGITGERSSLAGSARTLCERLDRLENAAGSPRNCVGIGISTPEQVTQTLQYAAGAIVGSAFVRALAEGGVAELSRAVRRIAEGAKHR